jgi:tetratricopeptide (TPR) repeat protein
VPRERAVPLGRTTRRDEEHAPGGPFAIAPGARDTATGNEAMAEARSAKGGDKSDLSAEHGPARPRAAISAADDVAIGGAAEQAAAPSTEKKKEEARGGLGAQGGLAPVPPKDAYGSAMELYTAGRFAEAERAFDDASSSGSKNAASAALHAAKSAEAAYGCSKAASKYEGVASRYAGSSPGAEALWGAANCYKMIGNFERATVLYKELRSVAGYRDRAEGELENLKILAARPSRAQPAKPAATPGSPAAPAR